MFDDRKQRALDWLYTEQKITKMRYGMAERKRGVKREELAALEIRLENIDTCIGCMIEADNDQNREA